MSKKKYTQLTNNKAQQAPH